jgi:hypothetical protein
MDEDLVIVFASKYFYPDYWLILFAFAVVCLELSVIRRPYPLAEERLEPFFYYLKKLR